MKIKDSLDLGGNLLQNFCIDNYSDIDNANRGKGRTIFYTGNDVERKDHVIVFDGTSFKALAYMEDVADNAAFKALQDDVALLKGDVDTDAIINNMKEVSEFLSGFAEDANLMSVLDGKLDKTGGTIEGSNSDLLNINNTANGNALLQFNNGAAGIGHISAEGDIRMFSNGDGFPTIKLLGGKNAPIFRYNSVDYDILTSAGGTITSAEYAPLTIKRVSVNGGAIRFENSSGLLGNLGIAPSDSGTYPIFGNGTTNYTLLHEGNIGEYKAGGLVLQKVTSLNNANSGEFFYGTYQATNTPATNYATGFTLKNESVGYVHQLSFDTNSKLYTRVHNGTEWSAWKQIAFTDSNVAGAYKLVDASGNDAVLITSNGSANLGLDSDGRGYILYNSANYGMIGEATGGSPRVVLSGWGGVNLRTGGKDALIVNTSGNVGMGVANPQYKLDVDGHIHTTGTAFLNAGVRLHNAAYISSYIKDDNGSTTTTSKSIMGVNAGNTLLIGYGLQTTGQTGIYGKEIYFAPNGEATRMRINESGNVTIGVTDLAGTSAKLYVDGKIKFEARKLWGREFDGTSDITLGAKMQLLYFLHRDNTTTSSIGRLSEQNDNIFVNVTGENSFVVSTNSTQRLLINSSGNVLIGKTTDDGSKLQVKGSAKFYSGSNDLELYSRIHASGIQVGRTTSKYTGGYNGGLQVGENGTSVGYIAGVFDDKDAGLRSFFYGGTETGNASIVIKGISGNVGIGTASPTEKLHVVGNLHVTGNIIADGEVAAGGAAEEGDSTGGGGGAFVSKPLEKGSNSYEVTHGLDTEDVIVCIYEKNTSGSVVTWDMILTDVEVNGRDTIIVRFGSATTVEHKVVIMGAVA